MRGFVVVVDIIYYLMMHLSLSMTRSAMGRILSRHTTDEKRERSVANVELGLNTVKRTSFFFCVGFIMICPSGDMRMSQNARGILFIDQPSTDTSK